MEIMSMPKKTQYRKSMMWREILAYNSSVLVLNVEILQNCTAVHLSEFLYEPKSNCFVVKRQKKQTLQSLKTDDGRNEISCIAFKVILDEQCGIFLPYFIVQFDKHCCLFSLDSSYEWLMRYNFVIPKILGERINLCDTSYFVENGPTLIWIVKNEIFIYKAECSCVKRPADNMLRVPVDLPGDCKELVATTNILWWMSGNPEQGMVVMKDTKGKTISSYLITIDNEKQKAHVVSDRQMIPFLYLSITSCAVVKPENLSLSRDDPSDNSYRVFISTMHNQLLEFSHGKYVKHINIPLSSCQRIQIFESPEDNLVLLCSEKDQICVVDWINSKILHTYKVFKKILLDDFFGLGTFQTLLFDGSDHCEGCETFDNFVITDFCKINMDKSKQDKNDNVLSNSVGCANFESKSIKSSVDGVVNALMKKVQATEMSITECKMEKSEKYSFIKRHCKNFNNMLINGLTGSAIPTQISGLGQLVSSCPEGCKGIKTPTTQVSTFTISPTTLFKGSDVTNSNKNIIVRSKWQEISSTEWIIGVELENVGPSSVSEISLCAVNKKGGTLVSSSKIFHSDMQATKQEGQMLSSGQRVTLVAMLSLPHFSSDIHVTVNLMLIWKHGDSGYLSQFCGVVSLQMDDLINRGRRKCQYLALYPVRTQVAVSTEHCGKNNVMELLKSNMDICEHLPAHKYHLKYSPFTSHVSWTGAKEAVIIDIFTRNYGELYLCLRLLGQQLQDGLSWSPLGGKSALEFLITAIKKEIRVRIHEINDILNVQLEKSDETEDSIAETEELSAKKRKISKHKISHSHQTIDSALCRKSLLNISRYACDTNKGFLALLFLGKSTNKLRSCEPYNNVL